MSDSRDLVLEMLAADEAARREQIVDLIIARAKSILCAIVAVLPCRCWPTASAIVRWIWPGFRCA